MQIVNVGDEKSVRARIEKLNPYSKGSQRTHLGAAEWDKTWPVAHAYFVLEGKALAQAGPDEPKVVVEQGQAVFWEPSEWFRIEMAASLTELLHVCDTNITPENYFAEEPEQGKGYPGNR